MLAPNLNGGDDSGFLVSLRIARNTTFPCGSEQARSHQEFCVEKNTGKKKPDLANAFNRATALRSNKCKGRFDARRALKGLRQVT